MRSTIKKSINASLGELTIVVRDGEAVIGQVVFHAERAHKDNRAYAEMHGWTQRIGDAAALGTFDEETGAKISPRQRLGVMQALVSYYESGASAWSVRGPSVSRDDASILTEAMKRAFPDRSETDIVTKVEGWTKAQRTAVMADSKLRDHVADIQRERTSQIDVESLLTEFDS